jgi:hypothetical protein
MNTQTLTTPMLTCNFFVAIPEADFTAEEPMRASSRDYGFDFHQEELAELLSTPIPASLQSQPAFAVAAEEFEARTLWFLS